MALQINQEIETINKGIVTSPYVRIESYRIDKFVGLFTATVAFYSNAIEASQNQFVYQEDILDPIERDPQPGPISPSIVYNGSQIEYPVISVFSLTVPESVTEDVYEDQTSTRTITYNDFDENGNVVEKTREETVTERVKTGTQTVTKNKIDLSVIGNDPYAWAYGKLKVTLGAVFGSGNIIDC